MVRTLPQYKCRCERVLRGNGAWASHKRACLPFRLHQIASWIAAADDYERREIMPDFVRQFRNSATRAVEALAQGRRAS